MAEQHLPERNHLGLVLPPPLPDGGVPKQLAKEHARSSRKPLPNADGNHHLYWPEWYLHDVGGVIWRFRQHPLNVIWLARDKHRWSHVLQDRLLDGHPSLMVDEIGSRTIHDFMDEARGFDELTTAVKSVVKTEVKMRRTHGRRPPLAALREEHAEQMEVVTGLVTTLAVPEVIPVELMKLGMARLMGQITILEAA